MINFGFISFDIFLILILLAILIAISFKSGKKLLGALIISIYPALLITEYLPFIKISDPVAEAVIFILIYILSTLVLWKNIHIRKIHSTQRKFIDYTLLSVVYLFLILSIWSQGIPALQTFHSFEPQIVDLVTDIPFGIYLIFPLVVLIITNRHDRN